MSFVDQDGIQSLIEELIVYSWPEGRGQVTTPFPSVTYRQAMDQYGSDKPDTRFLMTVSLR